MANTASTEDKVTEVRTAGSGVALQNPTLMPDGMQILSGPIPGGQIASNATQATARSTIPEALNFAGYAGGPFTIYGSNFGPVGMVHVGQTQVTVTSWQHYRIKGLLPPGIDTTQAVTITDGLNQRVVISAKKPVAAATVTTDKK